MRVLHSPNVFSNAVSGHLAVPNGFDPPEHTLALDRITKAHELFGQRRDGVVEIAIRL
jgi:hypothetical protein